MKKDRKNIILESLANLLEERNMSKVTTALLAEKSNITEAALYRHFPSKRAIYAELFSFCDNAIFSKCTELKKQKISSKEKVKNVFLFFMIFIEKNKGFARLLSREALSNNEQNVVDSVNQFYDRFELSIKQMLNEDANALISQPGISSQLIVTCLEGNVGRYIRSKFKENPSSYIENIWTLLSINIFKN
ncbi:nucleoid occlusion factor SlmA [SAR86 cluster bacterium]|jgi:TetR/AcrR family transcriptional regulator|nr:nucleoid occlusion factor SlmA [Gammaproteobacteria bacterium]MDC3152924.1 nucleoid occlusion factor SlmA [SAR86 cluster bacterium]RCL35164.1 MAG: nucleoid occlusion factor SlmA [SAR86 cluster bacterium]URQ69375.1 nucleoid occlusion factor SlmA [SAR86 cluster bacterium]|tara:strand:+ start:1531 stop:2100 length:570 start_codon:yes stop_codon:yes gene_type:complete